VAKSYEPIHLSFGFISLILSNFSLSSQPFCLEKDALVLPFGKNAKNLRELFSENKQNKPETQVIRKFYHFLFPPFLHILTYLFFPVVSYTKGSNRQIKICKKILKITNHLIYG